MEDLILEIFNKIKLHNCKINHAILYRNFYIVKIEKRKISLITIFFNSINSVKICAFF